MPNAKELIERARMFEERADRARDPISRQHYREMAAHYRSLSVEDQETRKAPDTQWSVKNQARMRLANDDPPYADTADALRHWPETGTAVAVRSIAGRVGLLPPLGVSELVELIVRPTPAFLCRMGVYQARVARKQSSQNWPKLRFDVGD